MPSPSSISAYLSEYNASIEARNAENGAATPRKTGETPLATFFEKKRKLPQ
jgi:hypothetical protein